MVLRCCTLLFLALSGFLTAVPVTLVGAVDKPPAKPWTAKEIAEEWRFNPEVKEKRLQGVYPKGSHKLYNMKLSLTGASFEDSWNFYAKKCGADEKYGPIHLVSGQVKDGQYVIVDYFPRGEPRSTTFAFTTDAYTVSVQLWESTDKNKVHVSVTVGAR